MVASLDLRVAWVRFRRTIHLPQRTTGSHLSYHFPCGGAYQLWHLRKSVVHLQSRCYGLVSNLGGIFYVALVLNILLLVSGTVCKHGLVESA
jgi:hypothetical protein